jgi:lipopolysaccharide transport system permease protein
MLRSLWTYRHFIKASILGELRGRFARSVLGGLWFIIHPLAQAVIFALVFAEVIGAKLPAVTGDSAYPIYLLSGMAAWGLFSEILSRCLNVFIDNAGTLKKVSFPRLCLPIVIWGTALINHLFLVFSIMVVFAFLGHSPSFTWIAIPIGMVCISILAFGIGVTAGVFNIFTRDVGQTLTVILGMWFWLTPIVYVATALPESLRWLIELNPMTPLVQFYQDILLRHVWPDLTSLAGPTLFGLFMVSLAFFVFRRASPEMVDAL